MLVPPAHAQGEQPHCGFPEVQYLRHAERLARQGLRVVVVEQTETPEMLRARNDARPAGQAKARARTHAFCMHAQQAVAWAKRLDSGLSLGAEHASQQESRLLDLRYETVAPVSEETPQWQWPAPLHICPAWVPLLQDRKGW